jgi:cell division protein FtsB
MRIRRSVTRFVLASVFPAIAIAITSYYGYFTVAGPRGFGALSKVDAQLTTQDATLADLQNQNGRMKHRIDLLAFGHADPDLVTEIARSQMLASSPGQVAIPRDR